MRASANPAVTVLTGAARVALRHDIQDFPRTLRNFLAERKTGAMLWVLLALGASGAAAADLSQLRPPAGGDRPVVRQKAPIGSVSPQVGPWHTFARVTASGLAGAEGIRVVWFPGDDDSRPQAGAITATLRARTAPDQVEIEIPADAGGPQGGVVRILAFMPGKLQPVFVARFTIGAAAQVASSQNAATTTGSFELAAGERTGWPLAIGQPGPIDVRVSAHGAPVVLTLTHPGGRSEQQTGSGTLALQANATPADVARGQLWTVGLRPASATRTPLLHAARAAVKTAPGVVASGSITVKHPPGDATRAQGEAAQRSQPIGGQGAVGTIAAQRSTGAELQLVAPGSSTAAMQAQHAARLRAQFERARQSSSSAPSTAAAITELSASEGRPGDQILIKGTGFGAQQGTVTFSVEPNSALAAPIAAWSDTVILVNVPDVSGLAQPYAGQLRVEGAASLGAPFRFIPAYETRVLAPQFGEFEIDNPGAVDGNICHPACSMGASMDLFFGHRGDDHFFRNRTLKNGWKVYQVYLAHVQGGDDLQGPGIAQSADANITEARVGTDSPYVSVHWWQDAFGFVDYVPRVIIAGPKGVPHE
jgi:hypothetical protein